MRIIARRPNRPPAAGIGPVALLCLAVLLFLGSTARAADFNKWAKESRITFRGYAPPSGATPLTNVPMLVVLNTTITNFSYNQFASSDGYDLRFSDSTRTNELAYEIDQWTPYGSSYIWVRVPVLTDTNTYIYAFWGNPDAAYLEPYSTNGTVWSEGYAGVWHLAEQNATNRHDSSVNANTGYPISFDDAEADGIVGRCNSFSSGNDVIVASNHPSLNTGSGATLELWFNADDLLTPYRMIAGKSTYWAGNDMGMHIGNSTDLEFFYDMGRNSDYHTISAGQWYHAVGTYDGAARRLYLDGTRERQSFSGGQINSNSYNFTIGMDHDYGVYFNGDIDEVRLSSVARSSNWVWACWLNMISNDVFNTYGAVENGPWAVVNNDDGASDMTLTSATLNGYIGSTGQSPVTAYFYWGLTDGGTNESSWSNSWVSASGQSVGPISHAVSDLTTDRVHYYRCAVENAAGRSWAAESSSFLPGEVYIVGTQTNASEDGDVGEVTFYRPAAASDGPLTVSYTMSGTAQGSDYSLDPGGSVTILTGETSAVVRLTGIEDGSPEPMETAIFTLSPGRYVRGQSVATVYIADHVVRYYDKQSGNWTDSTTWESLDGWGDDAGPPGVDEGGEIDEGTVNVTAANQISGRFAYLKSGGTLKAAGNTTDFWKDGTIVLEGGTALVDIDTHDNNRTTSGDFLVVTNSTVKVREYTGRSHRATFASMRFEKQGNQTVNLESDEANNNQCYLRFPSATMGQSGTVNVRDYGRAEFGTISGEGDLTKTGSRPLTIYGTSPGYSGSLILEQGDVYASGGAAGVVGCIGTGPAQINGGRLRPSYAYSLNQGTINLNSGGTLRMDENATDYLRDATINLKGGTLFHRKGGDNNDRTVRGNFYVYTNSTIKVQEDSDRDRMVTLAMLRFNQPGNQVVNFESGQTAGNANMIRFWSASMLQDGTVSCSNSVRLRFDSVTGSGRLTKTGDRPLYLYGGNPNWSGGLTVLQGTVDADVTLTSSDVGTLGLGVAKIYSGGRINVSENGYAINRGTVDVYPGGRLYAYRSNNAYYELGGATINLRGGVLELNSSDGTTTFGGDVNVVTDSTIELRAQDLNRWDRTKRINTLAFYPGPQTLTVDDVTDRRHRLHVVNPVSLVNDAILVTTDHVYFLNVISGSGTLTKRGGRNLILQGNSSGFDGTIIVEAGTLDANVNNTGGPGAIGTGTATIKSGARMQVVDNNYAIREGTVNVESNAVLYAYRWNNASYELDQATINMRGGTLQLESGDGTVTFGGDVVVQSNSMIELIAKDLNGSDKYKRIDGIMFDTGTNTVTIDDTTDRRHRLRLQNYLTFENDGIMDIYAYVFVDGGLTGSGTLTIKGDPNRRMLLNGAADGFSGTLVIDGHRAQAQAVDCINGGTVDLVNGGRLDVDRDTTESTAMLRGGTIIMRDGSLFRYDNRTENRTVNGIFMIASGTNTFDVVNDYNADSQTSTFDSLRTYEPGGTIRFVRRSGGGNQRVRFSWRQFIYHDMTCYVTNTSPLRLNGTYHYRDATLTKTGPGSMELERDVNVRVNGGADILDDLQAWMLVTNAGGTVIEDGALVYNTSDGLWTYGGSPATAITATPGNIKGTNAVFGAGTSFAAEDAGIVEITGVSSGMQYTFEVDLANLVSDVSNVVSNVKGNPLWDDVFAVDIDTIRCKVTPQKSGSVYFIWDNVVSELDADVTAVRVPFITNGDGATNVTPTSAYLTGELFSNLGLDTTVFVYWGETDGSNNVAAWANTNSWSSASPGWFSHQVGLDAGKGYFYRYSATNANGRFWADSSEAFSTAEVRIDTLDRWGNEDPGNTIQFSVVREGGATEGDLTVYLSFGGTASNGVDYTALQSQVTIPDGSSNLLITVTPILDADDGEIAESVVVALEPGPYRIGTPGSASGTIADDDIEAINQEVTDIDSSGATLNGIVIATAGAPNPDVYICWGTSDAGTASTGAWDFVESLGANWTNGASFGTNVTLPSTAMYYYRCYVTNDTGYDWSDTVESFTRAEIQVVASDPSATEGGDTGAFTVYRPANCTNGALTVSYTVGGDATPGSDYPALAGSLVLSDGATSRTVVVSAILDGVLSEAPEDVVLTLTSGKYTIGAQNEAQVTILDGDGDPEDWPHRMRIVFDGYTKPETLVNFPAPVVIGTNLSAQGFSYDQLGSRSNGADIIFLSADASTVVPHEIEHWGGATNATISPTNLSGLAFWVDAADASTLATNGSGQVLQWDDKSGFGRHMDTVGGTPYVVTDGPNGRTVIGFDGDGDVICTTTNFDGILSEYTILTVARYTGGDNQRVISSRTRNWLFGFHNSGDERWHAEGWIHNGGSANTGWHVHTGTINNDSDPKAAFWKDRILLTSNDTGSNNSNYKPGRIQAGGWQTSSECSKCEVAEIIIYDRILNATEIDEITTYLEQKYAVNTVVDEKSYFWVRVPELYQGAHIWMYWGNTNRTTLPPYTTDGSVWANGFVGVYHMTGSADDSGPNSINANPENGASLTEGVLAGGYDVSSGGHLDLTANSAWDVIDSANKNTWTMSLWANPDTTGSDGCLLSQYNGSFLWWLDTGGIDNYVFLDNGGQRTPEGSGIGAQVGAWQYVTVRKSGGTIRLYVDSALSGSCSGDIDPSGQKFSIGTEHGDSTSRPFNGQFDEARISDTPRSDDWIWAEWASMVSPLTFCTNGPVESSVAPDVVDAGASDVVAFSANMNGTLVSTGASATAVFLYWDTVDHGTNLTWPNSVKWESPVSEGTYSYKAVDLLPDTEYHYRFSATNAAGRVWTVGESSFTTPDSRFEWRYRMKITFSGYTKDETLTDFPALIKFDTGMTNFYSGFEGTNWYELRFMDGGETRFLSYEVEKWDDASNSYVWVRVPELIDDTTCIWAYWGNSNCVAPPATAVDGSVWNDEFVVVNHLAETGGNDVADSTANGYDGTLQNMAGTEWGSGMVSGGIRFDGDNDHYHLTGLSANLVNSATMHVLVKLDAATPANSAQTGFMHLGSGVNEHYPYTSGTGYFNTWRGGSRVDNVTLDPAVDRAQWHQVVITSETGGSGEWRLYQNGNQVRSVGAQGLVIPEPPQVGESNNGGNLDGMIDELRISSVARSADWVWAEWMNIGEHDTFCSYGPSEERTPGEHAYWNWAYVSDITTNSAVAYGRFSGTNADVYVLWDSVDRGEDTGAWANVSLVAVDVAPGIVSNAAMTGLSSGFRYAWRLYATNAATGADAWSLPDTFVTIGAMGVNNGGGATDIDFTSARLNAGLTIEDGTADLYTYWGAWDGGTDKGAWQYVITNGVGLGEGTYSTNMSGLYWGIDYYYRVYATNANGQAWAENSASFMTEGRPPFVPGQRGLKVRCYDSENGDGYIEPPDGPGGFFNATDEGRTTNFNEDVNYTTFTAFPGITSDDYLGMLWHGYFLPDETTTYSFATRSDDGSTIYIDKGLDGKFDEPGDKIVDNSGWHGEENKDGDVLLTAGVYYPIAISFFEGGSSEALRARWKKGAGLTYDQQDWINPATGPFYCEQEVACLAITNNGASGVTANSAVFNGKIHGLDSVFDVYACWGTVDGGEDPGSWQNSAMIGAFTNPYPETLSYTATDLQDDMDYYFTFRAVNAATNMWSSSRSFRTTEDLRKWPYRMKITLTGYNRPAFLNSFPLLVKLHEGLTDFAYSQFGSTNGFDLRFSDSSGSQVLDYETENWDTNGTSHVWVKIPQITGPTTHIWAYWGRNDVSQPVYATNGATWSAGYLAVWHLSETNGQHRDSTGNGNWAYPSNGVTQDLTGHIDGYDEYDDSLDHFLQVEDNGTLDLSGSFTIETWYAPNRVGVASDRSFLWNKSDYASNQRSIDLIIESETFTTPGALRLWVNNTGAGNNWTTLESSAALNLATGVWTHVACTKNGTVGAMYQDGARLADDGGSLHATLYQNNLPVLLGRPGALQSMHGGVDEYRVSSVARNEHWLWSTFQCVASNDTFLTYGAVDSLPAVRASAPTGVTRSNAVFNGQVDRLGFETPTVYMCWGSWDGGTGSTGDWEYVEHMGSSWSIGDTFTNAVTLLPGYNYYYRVYATNSYGDSWSPERPTFSTADIEVKSTVPTVDELSGGTAELMVYRPLTATNQSLTVYYAVGGDAEPDLDYEALTGVVVIPAGATGATITVTPLPDQIMMEPDETVSVTLLDDAAYFVGASNTAYVTITDETRVDMTPWRGKMKITFSGYDAGTPLTNFPALVRFSDGLGGKFKYEDCKADGTDLRFLSGDESQVLSYEIEDWYAQGESPVWVNVPLISSSNDYIWAYWGNKDAEVPGYSTDGSAWNADYLGVYHLTEANVLDSTANGYDATSVVGSPSVVRGEIIGPALEMDRSEEIFTSATHDGDSVTLSIWTKNVFPPNAVETYLALAGVTAIQHEYGTKLRMSALVGGTWQNLRVDGALGSGETHVVGTFDGTTMRLYANGVQVGSLGGLSGGLANASSARISDDINSVRDFLDECRLSKTARSADWIRAEYLNQKTGQTFVTFEQAQLKPIRSTVIWIY